MTNALGLRLVLEREVARRLALAEVGQAHDLDDQYSGQTLDAQRRGKWHPWIPGATIDVWTPCAGQEPLTGAPWPHCYFVQTIGGGRPEDGSLHCEQCRAEIMARRAMRIKSASSAHASPGGVRSPATRELPRQGSLF